MSLSPLFKIKTLALLFPLLCLYGCIKPQPGDSGANTNVVAAAQETKVAEGISSGTSLMEQWTAVAAMDPKTMDLHKGFMLAQQMAAPGGEGLEGIFAVLADPEQPASAKMLAVVSLGTHVKKEDFNRLKELTAPDKDIATRGCAAHLIGSIETPEAFDLLKQLSQDEALHVRKVAILVLMRKGDGKAVEDAAKLWFLPEAADADRTEIIYGFPEIFAADHLDLFADALARTGLEEAVHYHALQILKTHGTAAQCESIQKFIDWTKNPNMESFARTVLADIQQRVGASEKGES